LRARTDEKIHGRPGGGRLGILFLASLFLVLVILVPAGGRAVAQTFEDEPILSLEVNSKVGMTLETLSRLTGIRTGLPYSAQAIRKSLDALYATGLFNDIVVDVAPIEGGVAVVYQFIDKTYLADLRIRGNRVFWTRTLTETMGLQIGEEFTEERWKSSITRLVNFLHRQGYLRSQVDTDVSQIPETNQVKVTVKVSENSRARIRETKFTGEPVFSNFRLWSLIRSNGGEFYGADTLDEDMTRLEDLYHENGYLKAVIGPPEIQYEEATDQVTITIPIDAEKRLTVRFEGSGPIPDNQLTPLLLFKDERSYDDSVFRASADRIADYYHDQGYPFARVEYTQEEVPDGSEIRALFTIQTGNFACLRSILFYGNTFFKAARLQEMIRTRPGNTLFCGTIHPDRLEADANTMQARYHEEGFQQIRIEPRVEYNGEKTLATLVFAVAEGPRSMVAAVQFEGEHALSEARLRQTIRLRPGRPYDEIPLRKDQEEILVLYHQLGYVYAGIEPNLDFSPDRSWVTLRYRITEDQRVRIGRILLNGNTFTREDVIRRELIIHPGDPYDETRIQISRRKIQQLGFVGNVRLEPITPLNRESKETVKDLRLTLQERPTKTLDLGVGYADVERLRGFIEGTHRNLWGTGRSLTLRAEASQIEKKYSATYREPWVLGFAMDGRLTAFNQTQVRSIYDLVTTGGGAGLEKKMAHGVTASLQYQFENNRFSNVVPEAELLPEDKRANIASLNPGIVWDTRNDPFNPTYGFINGLTFRDAALSLGSQVQFVKASAQSSWFYPITRWLVLAVSARGGAAERFGQTKTVPVFGATDLVPPSERFFLGGRSTVRGYQQDALGIINDTMVAKSDGGGVEFIGGNAMLLFNGELRLFLPGNMGLVFFNDRGNVFRNYKNADINFLKSTVGAGIWWNLFGAPLRLDYGYKLNRERNLCIVSTADPQNPFMIERIPSGCAAPVKESRAELHFTLGFAF